MGAIRYKAVLCKIGSTYVPVKQSTVDPGIELTSESAGYSVVSSFVAKMAQRQVITLQTAALATAMNLVPFKLGNVLTAPEIWFAKQDDDGNVSGNAHLKIVVASAKAVWRQISAQINQVAMGDLEMHAISSDGSNPVTFSEASLPSITDQNVLLEAFTLGPVKLDSTLIETQGITVSPGIELEKIQHSGNPYVDYIGINRANAAFDVETLDLKTALTTAAVPVTAFFRQLDNLGVRKADDANAAISVTLAQAYVHPTNASGAHGATARSGFRAVAVDEGDAEIVSVSLAADVA